MERRGLPEEARYPVRATDFARFQDEPADAVIASVVEGADESPEALDLDDEAAYTILLFARRAAARAIRSDDLNLARIALRAVALVDKDRIDPRDYSPDLALYAIRVLGGNVNKELDKAIALCPSASRSAFEASRARGSRLSLADCLLMQISTNYGMGFVESWTRYPSPPVELAEAAVTFADLLEREGTYVNPNLRVTDLPGVWFGQPHAKDVRVAGCVSVDADHIQATQPYSHGLLVFVADLANRRKAHRLVGAANAATKPERPRAATSIGRRLAVLIGGSATQGEDPLETAESLSRLLPIAAVAFRP